MKFGNKLIRNHYSKLQMLKDIKNESRITLNMFKSIRFVLFPPKGLEIISIT